MEISIIFSGLIFMFSIIVGMGPQNIFVFNTGLGGKNLIPVLTICIFGDILLALIGVYTIGNLGALRSFMTFLKFLSLLLIAYYAHNAWRSFLKPEVVNYVEISRASSISSALTFTFLNPAVYLDTVLLVGVQANSFGKGARWLFVVGVILASIVWYLGLGFAAKRYSKRLLSATAKRGVDLVTFILLTYCFFLTAVT